MSKSTKSGNGMMNWIIFGITTIMMLNITGCGSRSNKIKIGHKNYTEQRIVGQMMTQVIEGNTDYEVELTELGGTSICFEALKSGQIDAYPEYTGTGYAVVLNQIELKDPQKVYDYCKEQYKEKFNLTWLSPLGFNNTYTLTVRAEIAKKYKLQKISDIINVAPELVLGAEVEFLERKDGLPGLKEVYGIPKFKEEKAMDIGLTYGAMKEGKLDINDAFSTDGRILKFNLKTLEDDQQFFLPYYCSPLVTQDFIEKYPEALKALESLGNQVSEEEMRALNLAAEEGMDIKEIVKEFLTEKGLLSN